MEEGDLTLYRKKLLDIHVKDSQPLEKIFICVCPKSYYICIVMHLKLNSYHHNTIWNYCKEKGQSLEFTFTKNWDFHTVRRN